MEQKNVTGNADTSKTEGILLGFEDNQVDDMENDPRSNREHEDLVKMGEKIVSEHYACQKQVITTSEDQEPEFV